MSWTQLIVMLIGQWAIVGIMFYNWSGIAGRIETRLCEIAEAINQLEVNR